MDLFICAIVYYHHYALTAQNFLNYLEAVPFKLVPALLMSPQQSWDISLLNSTRTSQLTLYFLVLELESVLFCKDLCFILMDNDIKEPTFLSFVHCY